MEYECKTCGRSFESVPKRSAHNLKVHSVCKACGKVFRTKTQLKEHAAKGHKK